MANALAGETSPYLRAHAHNPVDWLPWGELALARARALDRPLLVSIGYAACHWCHVMERESFEDEATAALLNEHFVAVKVDREVTRFIRAGYDKARQVVNDSRPTLDALSDALLEYESLTGNEVEWIIDGKDIHELKKARTNGLDPEGAPVPADPPA